MASADLTKILLHALDDERKAEAAYAAVIAKFGPIQPFSNIIGAEQRHAVALERQLRRLAGQPGVEALAQALLGGVIPLAVGVDAVHEDDDPGQGQAAGYGPWPMAGEQWDGAGDDGRSHGDTWHPQLATGLRLGAAQTHGSLSV